MFGDTSHRDPEVYREIQKLFPERVAAALVQKVTTTLSPARVEGLHVYTSYAEAAAILYGLALIDESEARSVMQAARDEGLEISEQELDALIEAHSP
jgi:phosphatidate phosphatase APP1